MLGFTSNNLNIEYIFGDNIGMENYAVNEKMDYIFSTYLYYKYSENVSSTIIKYIYGLYDKIDEVKLDNNLSNVEKLWLIHWILLSKFNASEIFIITSIKYPNDIKFIQTYSNNIDTKCIFVDNVIKNEKDSGYLSTIKYLEYNKIEVDSIDDYLFNITEKKIQTPTTAYFPQTNIEYPDLLLVKNESLSELEFSELKDSIDYKELYIYSNYLPYKVIYNGFVFKINFNGYEKYVYIYGSHDNYKLKNSILDILTDVQKYVPSAIFNFDQYSYIVTSADKYPYTIKVTENNFTEYVDQFPHPFIRQDLKFTFNDIIEDDLSDQVSEDDINSEQLSLYKKEEIVDIKFKAYNNYLYNYIKSVYNNDSSIILEEDYDIFITNYNNIKKYRNYLSKQVEFQDIHGDYVDSNIGSIETAEFLDIQGFDSTTNLPIVLYVSENINYETFYLRQYKVAIGGLIPINNDELYYPYTSDVDHYEIDFVVNDYMDEQQDYNKLHNYIYNLSQDFDNLYKFNKTFNSENDIYRDFVKTEDYSLSYYVYTDGTQNLMIDNDSTNILPQKTLFIINEDNENDTINVLDNYYIKNNIVVSEDFYSYKFLQFDYIQTISYKYYYLLSNKFYTIDKLNYDLIYKLYNEIKQLQLTAIYKDPIITEYSFSYIRDSINIDTTNYENLQDFVLTDVNIINTYDTDDTNVAEYEDVMSVLIGEDIYKINVTDTTGTYLVTFFKYNDIIETENKFIIFNKVIGIDQYAYYSLYSDNNDQTFSDYFINSINNYNDLITLYNVSDNKFFNLSVNELSFNTNNNNPVILNKDLLSDSTIYQVSSEGYDTMLINYRKFNHIYEYNFNLIYSYISYNDDYIFNVSLDDIVMVQ